MRSKFALSVCEMDVDHFSTNDDIRNAAWNPSQKNLHGSLLRSEAKSENLKNEASFF